MKKMFKPMLVLLALLLCFTGAARAEGVKAEWNMDALTAGELSVSLGGAEDGLTAVLALYDGNALVSVSHKAVENSSAALSVNVKNAENGVAKLLLWNWEDISPASAVLSTITPDGITPKPLKAGSLKVSAWVDADGDGKRGEDDYALSGAAVSVKQGENIVAKTATDEKGECAFEELPEGEYTVEVTDPAGREAAGDNPRAAAVVGGETTEADFAFNELPGSISGLVWDDANGDGVKDSDERVMSGIKVLLTATDGSEKSTVTEADGSFGFDKLVPGEYTLAASTPIDRESTLENPRTVTVISDDTVVENFGFKQLWVSDDQRQNKPGTVAYKDIEPALEGMYNISFELMINTKGDNAILLGDSANGSLAYNTSSAILLFSTDGNLAVRNGDGNGGYTAAAVNLCPAETGKLYTVTVKGDITENTYTVSVTDEDGNTYPSNELHARKNGSKLDAIALISNSHSTTVTDGNYSDFYFYIRNFRAEEIVPEPEDPTYNGFAGRYYGITVNGKYIRGNMGKISADYNSVLDTSAQFLPRDMADGTFSLLCRSSDRRITTARQNSQLTSGDYATNDKTQHWYLEESENFAPDHLSYYLRSADNDVYIGLSGGYLAAVREANKVELVFNPLNDESPLYQVSRTEAYARLTAEQRARIVTFYETVAGDVFDRYSSSDFINWTFRARLDKAFAEVLSGDLDEDEQYERLVGLLSGSNAHLIQGLDSYAHDMDLPGTENLRYEIDGGTYGNYDFWRGTMQDGTMYDLKIYDGDELQQTIKLYVQDDEAGYSKKNAQTFLSVITKIPYVYRRTIRNAKIREDSANSFNCGYSDVYIRLNYHMGDSNRMFATLTHEMNHSLDQANGYWSHGKPWAKAMEDDMIMVSEYARSTVDEDFAEFGRLYAMCYDNQDRQKALQLLFPNRYASYWRLRHNNLDGFELWEDTEYLEY